MRKAPHRPARLGVAALALSLCAASPRPAEHGLKVISALLEARPPAGGHAAARYETDVEFEEPHLAALRDDEAMVEIGVLDRDGHGGRRLLEDLEDCRMPPDGSMVCPRGVVFHRAPGAPGRWRLTIAFGGRLTAASFHPPVTVRLRYSVSGGPETVHVGTIASCSPARGGPSLACRARSGGGRRRRTRGGAPRARDHRPGPSPAGS